MHLPYSEGLPRAIVSTGFWQTWQNGYSANQCCAGTTNRNKIPSSNQSGRYQNGSLIT
jgi:hypothetical protein